MAVPRKVEAIARLSHLLYPQETMSLILSISIQEERSALQASFPTPERILTE
jgi:hypothetical protein